jgi:hypothetical protein
VLDCNIALFSIDPLNERIRKHSANGGLCATVEKDYLTILKGEWKIRICKIKSIPLSGRMIIQKYKSKKGRLTRTCLFYFFV